MCFAKLLNLFNKKQPQTIPVPTPLSIPYPEEPPDHTRTIDNVDIQYVLNEWLYKYRVPENHWQFWRTKISIIVDPTISFPAFCFLQGEVRQMRVQPAWLNAGVIAHEQAHSSWSLLSDIEMFKFSQEFTRRKEIDPLVKFLFAKNGYGLTSDIEGHAEIYRYLNEKMPESLKKFYPRLI